MKQARRRPETPAVDLGDGVPLWDLFTTGSFVLLDRSEDRRYTGVVGTQSQRVTVATGSPTGPSPLARPDGVVVWATAETDPAIDDMAALADSLRRWAA